MSKLRVGVVRGGPSPEYEVSLATGGAVLRHLPERYLGRDILITKVGEWHCQGLPTTPEKLTRQVDVVFNALHGTFGEDGQIQKILDLLGLPYTGSGHLPSALGLNKILAKDYFTKAGIKTPRHIAIGESVKPEAAARLVFQKMAPPWIVKPASGGSSIGLRLVKLIKDLGQAIKDCFAHSDQALVEEYIRGKEATVGVVEKFRNQNHYALFPIQVVKPENRDLYDYKAKYSDDKTKFICPGHFSDDEKKELERMAVMAHQAIGARHYSRSDFIVSPRGIYILEINTLPGLTDHSSVPKALTAGGISLPNFLDHIIQLAL